MSIFYTFMMTNYLAIIFLVASDVPSSTIGQLDWSENDRGTSIHRAERFGESGPNGV